LIFGFGRSVLEPNEVHKTFHFTGRSLGVALDRGGLGLRRESKLVAGERFELSTFGL
jgi:hypothetical protein